METLTRKIDGLVRELGINQTTPGVAILIRQGNGFEFVKGYGLADINNKTPITEKTVFELASASKPITATAVLILHDQGKLSINDDIRKHLPEIPEYESGQIIRVRDILQHVSGLPDYMSFENFESKHEGYWTNSDYLSQFAAQKEAFPLTFRPRAKYEYNNTNYMLAAMLVERVSGKPFAEFMREEVFMPAEMTSTFVCDSPLAKPKDGDVAAIGYVKDGAQWQAAWGCPPNRNEQLLTAGDGAIWSNVEDVARWDLAVRQNKYFKPATAKAAVAPSKTRDGNTNLYGLGWTLYYEGNRLTAFGHEGYWGGFSTTYYFNMPKRRTTVMLGNGSSYGGDEFWYKVDALIDDYLANQ